jgi:uncharacterized membrane protein
MVDDVSTPAKEEQGPIVQMVRLRLTLIGPMRLLLSVVWLVAALAAGAPSRPSLLGFGIGAYGIIFLAYNDPRARFRTPSAEPRRLPANARVQPAWQHALWAAWPSTIGVSVLALVSIFNRPTLSAIMAGILAGLGITAVLAIGKTASTLYVDPRGGVVYRQ